MEVVVKRKSNGESEKKKRKSYSVLEKLRILEELNSAGSSTKEVSEKYGIPVRTLRDWRTKRTELEKHEDNYQLTNDTKRIRITPLDQLEEALFIWFDRAVKCGVNLTGPLVMTKALQLHRDMRLEKKFNASEGWFAHWKQKYNIRRYDAVCDGKYSEDLAAADTFKDDFKKLIGEGGYELCQIFNADERGLNYKSMPKKTLFEIKSETRLAGFEQNKERVTVIVCSNADGSFKLPLVVIGKSAKPRELKNLLKNWLPVFYANQKKAWMNSEIFEHWFRNEFVPRVKEFLEAKGLPQKAILLVDTASCHLSVKIEPEEEIKLKFLPPSTTSILQPMDHGIVESLKRRYKSVFVRSLLYAQKKNTDLSAYLKSITIRDVIFWLNDCWNEVPASTISRGWIKLIPSHLLGDEDMKESLAQNLTDEGILHNLRKITEYQYLEEECVRNWIHVDDDIVENDRIIPTNSELIAMVNNDSTSDAIDENIDSFGSSVVKIIPDNVVFAAETLLTFYYQENGLLSPSELATLRKAKQIAIDLAISQ